MVKARLMGTSSVTVQGQATLPKKIRDMLGIKPGDLLEFLVTDNRTVVVRKLKVTEEIEL